MFFPLGIVINATTSFKISHQKVVLEFLRDNDYYKPKMPYVGLVSKSLHSFLYVYVCICTRYFRKDSPTLK